MRCMRRWPYAAILLIGGLACAEETSVFSNPPVVPEPDASTTTDADAPNDAGFPAGNDGGPTLDAQAEDAGVTGPDATPTDAGPPISPPRVVRFAALGDTGEGNQAQYDVAAALDMVCLVQGCDFIMLLGDNFYDDGVRSVDDDQFRTKFEEPYARIQRPFYVTLGNHDFGEIPVQFWRTDFQIEYSARSSKWNMPDHFYRFVMEHVTFVSLDTNMIMLGLSWVRDQRDWVRAQIDAATTPWVIAFGHHPFKSNGSHGNAGNYEGLRFVPIVNGARLQRFFEDELCDRIDVYLAGHDHTRQWLERSCNVELIVSGAGAKTTDLERRDNNPTKFEDDTTEGFFWIEIADDTMTVEIWNRDGNLDFTDRVNRPSSGR